MDTTIPVRDALLEDNINADVRSKFESLDNVFALLDDQRSRQLVERVIPAVTYTGPFEVVGREDGFDPPTQLCSPCRKLCQRPPPIYPYKGKRASDVLPPEEFWIPHHDTLFQLIDCCFSQSGSCGLCQLLWHGIRRENMRHRSKESEDSRFDWHDGGLKVVIHQVNYGTFLLSLNNLVVPDQPFLENFHIWIHRRYRWSGLKLEQGPILAETTDSASTYSQIKKWLNHCQHNHRSCQIPRPSEYKRPTRLILIDLSAGTFQLVTQFPADRRYAAVSYRWGTGKDVFMLTQETEERMGRGLSTGLLPKTILDTFTIAHHLNLKYVWIDRLCIRQDSPKDWSEEASKMALIYKHAFLTISASCASHENQGCFRKRNAAGIQPLWFISNPLLLSKKKWKDEASYINSSRPEENQKFGGKLGHLADRGWVFQERIFSPRIVHFADEEVHWECRELEASELWPDGRQDWPDETPSKATNRLSLVFGPNNNRWDIYSDWHRVVRFYSARRFTYDGDKLPALSGLARESAETRNIANEKYLAGLWRSTVLTGLCWRGSLGRLRIPEHYLAPSWSWASLNGKIMHVVDSAAPKFTPAAKFKDAGFRFATTDPYGAVHDGWIHLFGHLKPVAVVHPYRIEIFEPHEPWHEEIRDTDGEPLPFLDRCSATVDIDTFAIGRKDSVPMFCLPVLKSRQHDSEIKYDPDFYCLLLVRNGSIKYGRSGEALPSPRIRRAEQYQRAGLARIEIGSWIDFNEWLDESPEEDIIIR